MLHLFAMKYIAYDKNTAAAEILAEDSFAAPVTSGIHINDVIPLSLGFEVCKRIKHENKETLKCGYMSVMVPKNSRYPIKINKTYCQNDPRVRNVTMMLYEGDSEYVSENHYLSTLRLFNLLPWENKCNSYHIVFDIDINGIATIQGIVHNEDGSDGEIYTMSLAVLSNDGSLSKCELIKQQQQMVTWFKDVQIKQSLKSQRNKMCLLNSTIQRNHVYLDGMSSALHQIHLFYK